MNWRLSQFRAHDLVEVRSVQEILATLDHNGSLESMPFMPEMLQYCGKQYRVAAVAHKTCDMVGAPGTGRRVQVAVHLTGLRCNGSAHDGCQAECNLFWKDAWLAPVGADGARRDESAVNASQHSARCSTERLTQCTRQQSDNAAGEVLYSCQATRMYEATDSLAWWDVRQYFYDVTSGNHSASRVLRVLFLAWLRRLVEHAPFGYRVLSRISERAHLWLTGRPSPVPRPRVPDGVQTPTGRLFLKEGERVRIKSKEEIEKTLNQRNRNRGLTFDSEEMAPYCGRVFKVRRSVTTIIEEPTGKMLKMKEPCVMLDGVVCKSEYARCRLNCPRAIPSYWREIWLERAGD